MNGSPASYQPDPDETRDIYELIGEVVPDPKRWLDTPNDLLGGAKPQALLAPRGSGQHRETETLVRQLVRSIRQGIFS